MGRIVTYLGLKEGGNNCGGGGLEQETLPKDHLSFILDTRCSEASHRGKGVLAKGPSLPEVTGGPRGAETVQGTVRHLGEWERWGLLCEIVLSVSAETSTKYCHI